MRVCSCNRSPFLTNRVSIGTRLGAVFGRWFAAVLLSLLACNDVVHADDLWNDKEYEASVVRELDGLLRTTYLNIDNEAATVKVKGLLHSLDAGRSALMPQTYRDLIELFKGGGSRGPAFAVHGLVAETLATHARAGYLTEAHLLQLLQLPKTTAAGSPIRYGAQITAIAAHSRNGLLGPRLTQAALTALETIDDADVPTYLDYGTENLLYSLDREVVRQDPWLRDRLGRWIKTNAVKFVPRVLAGQPDLLKDLGGDFPALRLREIPGIVDRRRGVLDRAAAGFDVLSGRARGKSTYGDSAIRAEIGDAAISASRKAIDQTLTHAPGFFALKPELRTPALRGVMAEKIDAISELNLRVGDQGLKNQLLATLEAAGRGFDGEMELALLRQIARAYPNDADVTRALIEMLGDTQRRHLQMAAVGALIGTPPYSSRTLGPADQRLLRQKLSRISPAQLGGEFRTAIGLLATQGSVFRDGSPGHRSCARDFAETVADHLR